MTYFQEFQPDQFYQLCILLWLCKINSTMYKELSTFGFISSSIKCSKIGQSLEYFKGFYTSKDYLITPQDTKWSSNNTKKLGRYCTEILQWRQHKLILAKNCYLAPKQSKLMSHSSRYRQAQSLDYSNCTITKISYLQTEEFCTM